MLIIKSYVEMMMSNYGLLKMGNRAGQSEMRQRILDFLDNLTALTIDAQEAALLRDVTDRVRENVKAAEPFATDLAKIQQVIKAAELDAAASKRFGK